MLLIIRLLVVLFIFQVNIFRPLSMFWLYMLSQTKFFAVFDRGGSLLESGYS